ncbi:MAG: hypothetical protein Q6363_001415 [Candidatus Njordarchaeota archaeon]
MTDRRAIDLLFVDSIEIKDRKIKKNILINPAVRLFRSTSAELKKYLSEIIDKTKVIRAGSYKAYLFFDAELLLWKIDFEIDLGSSKAIIGYSSLYPFIRTFLVIMEEIKWQINHSKTTPNENLQDIIERLINLFLPYRLYYRIYDPETAQNKRLSEVIIQKIVSKKKVPSITLTDFFARKPKIVNKSFDPIDVEYDLALTYFLSREFLPFQMIEHPPKGVSKQIINEIMGFKNEYAIFFFEDIGHIGKILKNIISLTEKK